MEKRKQAGSLCSTSVRKRMKRLLALAMTVLMINSVIDYSGIVTTYAKAAIDYGTDGFGQDESGNTIYEPAELLTTESCQTKGISAEYSGYYAISNSGQLFWFAERVNSGNVTIFGKLMSDIDLLGKAWTPIGTYSDAATENNKPYTGTFDGDYHVISNLTVNIASTNETGFFGRTQNAVIKNLGIEAASVMNQSSVRAGILGGEIYKSTVINCYTTGTVSTGNTQAGGIAGESASSTLTNCFTTMSVLTNSGTAVNCYAKTTENEALFTSGELTYSLGSSSFGQTLSGDSQDFHPVFLNGDSSNKVYKISYQVGAAVEVTKYVNSSTSTKLLSQTDITVEPGYLFEGWYQGEDTTNLLAAGSDTTNFTADTVYHAALEKLTGWNNISYYAGNNGLEGLTDGGALTGLSPVDYYPGYTCELPTPKHTGFKFLGWYADATFSGEVIQSVSAEQTGDLTLYAKFEKLTVWDGTTTNTDWLGEGKSDNPYLIGTPDQLAGLADSVNEGNNYSNKCFKVIKNLDMGITWTPIGTETNKFCGSFDGDLHTVTYNITNTNSEARGMALFGYLGAGAELKNLGTAGTITTAGKYTGGIAGLAQDGTIAITNCWSGVNINYTSGDISAYVGGILGQTDNNGAVTMTNSFFTGTISGDRFCPVGGLCSNVDTAEFNAVNCYSTGTYNISDIPTGDNLVNFLAYNNGNGNVKNCYYLNKTRKASTQGIQITSEMLTSGELARLLQDSNTSDKIFWGQTCGSGYPVLTTDETQKPLKVSYVAANQIVKTQYVNCKTGFTLLGTMDSIAGCDLIGWTDANDHPVSGVQTITEDTTYKATIALKEGWHTITYKVGNADSTSLTKGEEITGLSVTLFSEGSEIILPTSYTYKGAILAGWYTDEECIEENKVTKIASDASSGQIFYGKFISWDGSTLTEPQRDANGTYLIGTPAELAWFAYRIGGGNITGNTISGNKTMAYNVKLTADINLGSYTMYMIGEIRNSNAYCGTFDGDGHTITIDTVNGVNNSDKIALFQYLGSGAKIMNWASGVVSKLLERILGDWSAGLRLVVVP